MTIPIHSRIIADAGRKTLTPLGMFQKGRSRTWLADNGWWVSIVEFQPSGWAKGSYLNVGCMWLWHVKDYYSFDLGYRVDEFHPFTNDNEFKKVADRLVHHAAQKVLEYKRMFSTIIALSDYYLSHPPNHNLWDGFHAALAHGLSGRPHLGAPILEDIVAAESSYDWERKARGDAMQLLTIIQERSLFRDKLIEHITATRVLLKLPKFDAILFE